MFLVSFRTALTPHQTNILVEDSGHIVIADFGLAEITRDLNPARSPKPSTLRWVAPEVWVEGGYSEKADIFSFAMVMIEVRHQQYTELELIIIPHQTGIYRRDSFQRLLALGY